MFFSMCVIRRRRRRAELAATQHREKCTRPVPHGHTKRLVKELSDIVQPLPGRLDVVVMLSLKNVKQDLLPLACATVSRPLKMADGLGVCTKRGMILNNVRPASRPESPEQSIQVPAPPSVPVPDADLLAHGHERRAPRRTPHQLKR